MTITTTIELALKLAILESGSTQRQVADHADIPEKRLSDIVRCRTVATADERRRLSATLNKEESSLFRPPPKAARRPGHTTPLDGSRRLAAYRTTKG